MFRCCSCWGIGGFWDFEMTYRVINRVTNNKAIPTITPTITLPMKVSCHGFFGSAVERPSLLRRSNSSLIKMPSADSWWFLSPNMASSSGVLFFNSSAVNLGICYPTVKCFMVSLLLGWSSMKFLALQCLHSIYAFPSTHLVSMRSPAHILPPTIRRPGLTNSR